MTIARTPRKPKVQSTEEEPAPMKKPRGRPLNKKVYEEPPTEESKQPLFITKGTEEAERIEKLQKEQPSTLYQHPSYTTYHDVYNKDILKGFGF